MTAEREEEKISGCLLQADIHFPQEKIIICGQCPNRSSDIGNLATKCKVKP